MFGCIVEDRRIQPSQETTLAIQKFPEFKNYNHLQSFLGLTEYFRKFTVADVIIPKPFRR